MAAQNNTVIIGAGIIGLSTAYYLSLSSNTPANAIHVVEASPKLFACASGRAGGFVVKDWFAPAVASLGALSFRLHAELAEEHGGRERWGYSRSTGTSMVSAGADGARGEDWLMEGGSRAGAAGTHEVAEGTGPAWLTRRKGDEVEVLSTRDSTAQVDPLRLCKFLLGQSLEKGVRLHQPAKVLSVSKDTRGELATVRVAKEGGEEVDIPCSRLVITAGPWTPRVFSSLFPTGAKIPVSPLAGHSLTLKSPRWTKGHEAGGCHAVFATDASGFSPEVFSRIGEEIYIAGLNDSSLPLPELATDSEPHPEAIERLKQVSKRMLGLPSGDNDLEILNEGLCFRPITARGPPIVTRVPDKMLGAEMSTRGGGDGGVFIGVGHGPWGISQSLGTGKVLAEMIEGQPTSASVKGLSL